MTWYIEYILFHSLFSTFFFYYYYYSIRLQSKHIQRVFFSWNSSLNILNFTLQLQLTKKKKKAVLLIRFLKKNGGLNGLFKLQHLFIMIFLIYWRLRYSIKLYAKIGDFKWIFFMKYEIKINKWKTFSKFPENFKNYRK